MLFEGVVGLATDFAAAPGTGVDCTAGLAGVVAVAEGATGDAGLAAVLGLGLGLPFTSGALTSGGST